MVRLKAFTFLQVEAPRAHFNSSMVRLKASYGKTGLGGGTEFQFLNGAIKSGMESIVIKVAPVFQFLNGAIKSF